jgi:hypothetical protein
MRNSGKSRFYNAGLQWMLEDAATDLNVLGP